MPNLDAPDLSKALRDALYVSVGLGVIAVQKAQVRRRELQKQVSGQADEAREQLGSVSTFLEDRVKGVEERMSEVEDRVETLLDELQSRLPDQAGELVKQARATAKDARGQLQSLVNRASAA